MGGNVADNTIKNFFYHNPPLLKGVRIFRGRCVATEVLGEQTRVA